MKQIKNIKNMQLDQVGYGKYYISRFAIRKMI